MFQCRITFYLTFMHLYVGEKPRNRYSRNEFKCISYADVSNDKLCFSVAQIMFFYTSFVCAGVDNKMMFPYLQCKA